MLVILEMENKITVSAELFRDHCNKQIPSHWQNNKPLMGFTQDMPNRILNFLLNLQLYASLETVHPLEASNLLFISTQFSSKLNN